MSKLIYVDRLKKDILALRDCYNGFSDTYDKACIIGVIDEQPTIEERKTGEWGNAPRQLTDRTISKMGIVTVDVDAVKKRLKELGMSRRKLADRIGYADVRSVYRMLKTGKMSATAWERMNTILFDDERRQS